MASEKLKIGVDLDNTLFGFPGFFVPFVQVMHAFGHDIYCTSNRTIERWNRDYRDKVASIGLNPDLLDVSLLQSGKDRGMSNKIRMAKGLDVVFDDLDFNDRTDTPVFVCPINKSKDHKRK